MKRLWLLIALLTIPVATQARTAAFRVWLQHPADTVRYQLYARTVTDQTGNATIDSAGYFAYWNVAIDDSLSYTLQVTYVWTDTTMRKVSSCITLQLVYNAAVDTLKYALWLPQALDSLRWATRTGTGVAGTGLGAVDSSDFYVWWLVPVDSANRYLLNANFWWDGATRPISDIENIIPYGSDGGGFVTLTDSVALARWVWTLYDDRTVTNAGGAGGYSYTINFRDTSTTPDENVNRVSVRVNNVAQSGTVREVLTDIYGEAVFNLDSGSYVCFTTDAYFKQNIDTFTVSDTGTYLFRNASLVVVDDDTLTTTVDMLIRKPNGTANDSARVNIELISYNDSMLYINDVTVAATYKQFELRANTAGLALFNLYPNVLFEDSVLVDTTMVPRDSTYYRATVRNKTGDNIVDQFYFRVPVSDSVNHINLLSRWRE